MIQKKEIKYYKIFYRNQINSEKIIWKYVSDINFNSNEISFYNLLSDKREIILKEQYLRSENTDPEEIHDFLSSMKYINGVKK